MIQNNLSAIDGINIYPIISIIMFFLFFSIVLFVVLRSKPSQFSNLERAPLEDNTVNDLPNLTHK